MELSSLKNKVCKENDIFEQLLNLDGKDILELGCGKAQMTRLIATSGHDRRVIATEVDEVQHGKNLLINDLPNTTFMIAGGEDMPFADHSFDLIFMFKSLHHVPIDNMNAALKEVARVLRPGGQAYISEPIFAGDFNEVLRLFHDEEKVRAAALQAIRQSVADGDLPLLEEFSFNTQMIFNDFDTFEANVINVTHSDHRLSDDLLQVVKDKFMCSMKDDCANFLLPIRVNLLQKKITAC